MVVNLQPMEEGTCLVVSVMKICKVEDKGFLDSCGIIGCMFSILELGSLHLYCYLFNCKLTCKGNAEVTVHACKTKNLAILNLISLMIDKQQRRNLNLLWY